MNSTIPESGPQGEPPSFPVFSIITPGWDCQSLKQNLESNLKCGDLAVSRPGISHPKIAASDEIRHCLRSDHPWWRRSPVQQQQSPHRRWTICLKKKVGLNNVSFSAKTRFDFFRITSKGGPEETEKRFQIHCKHEKYPMDELWCFLAMKKRVWEGFLFRVVRTIFSPVQVRQNLIGWKNFGNWMSSMQRGEYNNRMWELVVILWVWGTGNQIVYSQTSMIEISKVLERFIIFQFCFPWRTLTQSFCTTSLKNIQK